jgi:prevent-host-death family protein
MCYSSGMAEVPSRELRNNTRDLIARANKGEAIVITVDGIPMAELQPVSTKRRWVPKAELEHIFFSIDRGLIDELNEGLLTMAELDQRSDAMWDGTK